MSDILHTAIHCDTLRHTVTHTLGNALQYSTAHWCTLQHAATHTTQDTATQCSILQHAAGHCPTIHHTTTHCIVSTLQLAAAHCTTLQHSTPRCNMLHHQNACGTLQTPAHVRITAECDSLLHTDTLQTHSSESHCKPTVQNATHYCGFAVWLTTRCLTHDTLQTHDGWGALQLHAHMRHTTLHNTEKHTAERCRTLQYTAGDYKTLQNTTLHCCTLQHAITHCSTLQHHVTVDTP